MFNSQNQSKIDVLESKLDIYEKLSREMLTKLESAVAKISESNQRIATILAKHDERIDQTARTDELMVKMINEVKLENENDHKKTNSRIDDVDKKLDELFKFRWQLAGISALIVFVGGILVVILPGHLTNSSEGARIEQVNPR